MFALLCVISFSASEVSVCGPCGNLYFLVGFVYAETSQHTNVTREIIDAASPF